MHRRVSWTTVALVLVSVASVASLVSAPPAVAAPDEAAAQAAGTRFGQALTRGDASLLGSLLPGRGKVKMVLTHLGPEKGHFSASQVQALLQDFLEQGQVRSFRVERIELAAEGYALVHGHAVLTDRQGRQGESRLHLGLQAEGERWVLREIREASR